MLIAAEQQVQTATGSQKGELVARSNSTFALSVLAAIALHCHKGAIKHGLFALGFLFLPALIALVAHWAPALVPNWFAAFLGLISTFATALEEEQAVQTTNDTYAKLCRQYEVAVLDIDWNPIACDLEIDLAYIESAVFTFRSSRGKIRQLRDLWGDRLDQVAGEYGQIIIFIVSAMLCERAHRGRALLLKWISYGLFCISLYVCLTSSMRFDAILLAVILPGLPIPIWILKSIQKHQRAAFHWGIIYRRLCVVWEKLVLELNPPTSLGEEISRTADHFYNLRCKYGPVLEICNFLGPRLNQFPRARDFDLLIDRLLDAERLFIRNRGAK